MATFGGNYYVQSSTEGLVSGQIDESSFNSKFSQIDTKLESIIARDTEIAQGVNASGTKTNDTYLIVSGVSGVQATWGLVDGLRLNFQSWLGGSLVTPFPTWFDTAISVA